MTDLEKSIFKHGVVDGLGIAREIIDAHLGAEDLAVLERSQFVNYLLSISETIGDRISQEIATIPLSQC